MRTRTIRKWTPYGMITPYFLLYVVFSLFPILFSLVISFTNWDGFSEMTFAGLGNYKRVLAGSMFFRALYNTVLLMIFTIPLEIIAGLTLASFLKDFFKKSRNAFQLINFLPYITTPVAIGILFQILFDWRIGMVNGVLVKLGLLAEPIYWLGVPWGSRFVVVVLSFWQNFGYVMVMFLAGLSIIPDELYEAAKIDGAKWKDSFLHITIPMLKPIMTFVVVTGIIGGFKLFDEPQILFQSAGQPVGGPQNAVMTAVMFFYQVSFKNFQFGFGAAIAYALFIVISVFSLLSMKVMNRGGEA